MHITELTAAVVLSLSFALSTASCVAGSTEGPEVDGTGGLSVSAAEPTGEAAQPAYEDVFHFVVVVKDDGQGDGGGWQKATATLKFSDWRKPFAPYFWKCPISVEMPIRNKWVGHISPQLAARMTAAITTEVTEFLMHSRSTWLGQEHVYCAELYDLMEKSFNPRPHPVGARVRR